MAAVMTTAGTGRKEKADKPEGFRQAMSWFHTWVGLVLGWVLFAMFLTGSLAFFRAEITAWMTPEVQVRPQSTAVSVAVAERYLTANGADAARWFITPSTPRQPLVYASYQAPAAPGARGAFKQLQLDPATGEPVVARATRGGDFFYRFHFDLSMGYPWGRWLASIAGMAMLIAIITGIIIHKKIFTDFFTLRSRKGGQRAWMDGHNVLSVLGLPFHLMITFSGLVLFMSMLMPAGILAVYDNERAYFDEAFPNFSQARRSGQAAPLAPLAPMVQAASEAWGGARVGRIVVNQPGDAAATVIISGEPSARVTYGRSAPSITFNGATGEQLSATPDLSAVRTTVAGLVGLHLGLFAEPLLRWVYFLVSLAGTGMVGTGLVLWVAKRRQKGGKDMGNRLSLRVVNGLNAGSIAGLFVATAAFFWANRLIAPDVAGRSALEVQVLFGVWLATGVYAFVRRRTAWRDLLALGAVLYLLIPVLDLMTTPRNLVAAVQAGDWAFAGFELTAVAAGGFLTWLAYRAGRAPRVKTRVSP